MTQILMALQDQYTRKSDYADYDYGGNPMWKTVLGVVVIVAVVAFVVWRTRKGE